MLRFLLHGGLIAAIVGCCLGIARADDVPTVDDLPAEVERIFVDLDSERFGVREHAAERLERLAEQPELVPTLSELLRQQVLDPQTSFEVRRRIEPLLARLTARLDADAARQSSDETPVDAEEIDALVARLTDDEYSARVGAAARMEWLLARPPAVCPIYLALKRRMSDPALDDGARREIAPLLDRARGAWLLLDPAEWKLPDVSEAQIAGWVDELARKTPPHQAEGRRFRVQDAERELLDALARDELAPIVARALVAKMAQGGLDDAALVRLEAVQHWTRPALVAEFWQTDPTVGDLPTGGLRQGGVQYLLVDVPTLGEGAERPSHFDRIDDRTAHCASGNALLPGDYPVGVLFAHPQQEGAFFHLVNLPTPRRRLVYDYHLRTDESERAREISRRTLERFAAEKRPLTAAETMLLSAVEPEEFSRFVGPYLNSIDDGPLAETLPSNFPGGQMSRHALFCMMLAQRGTPTAIPGLMKAIESKRFLPPTQAAPCDMPWIAALAIAGRVKQREGWPDVDDWLARLIERAEPIVLARERLPAADEVDSEVAVGSCPEIGATAAAILLRRHGISPSVYGLAPLGSQILAQVGCPGHEFTAPAAREELLRWWREHRPATTTSASTGAPRR